MRFRNRRSDDTFIMLGFSNWKKATEKFQQHEHSEAIESFHSLQQPSIISQLNTQIASEQAQRRELLLKQLRLLKYLMRQGLATRGHIEEEGNLMQLLLTVAEHDATMKKWLVDGKYLSHDIINEQIQLMAHQVLRSLVSKIKEARYFAVICDETQDMSCKEQLGISIRWVDNQYSINEDLIGMYEVTQTDAATLVSVISDGLTRCSLSLNDLHGQAYDGASNMAGKLSGVAKRMLDDYPKAHFIHCMAHCLNLCLQDVSKNCTCIREALSLTSELSNVIRASPKRLALFERVQKEMAPGSPRLKPLCPTRWTVRTEAINALLKNYGVVCHELEQLTRETGEVARKSCGLLALMDKFSVFFGLKLSHLVFAVTEQLSNTLQSSDITAQEATKSVDVVLKFFLRHRCDSSFTDLYKQAVDESQELTQPPVLPRARRVSIRIDSGSSSHVFQSPEEYFRKAYYEVIDMLTNELKKRFQHPSFITLHHMEELMIKSCNKDPISLSDDFCQLYSTDIDIERLRTQLSLKEGVVVHKVTSIRTVIDLMNSNSLAKTLLNQVDKLLRIYLTIPLSTSTAERAFSTLRRLKNYLRSTMTQTRLNHAIILHTHKDKN